MAASEFGKHPRTSVCGHLLAFAPLNQVSIPVLQLLKHVLFPERFAVRTRSHRVQQDHSFTGPGTEPIPQKLEPNRTLDRTVSPVHRSGVRTGFLDLDPETLPPRYTIILHQRILGTLRNLSCTKRSIGSASQERADSEGTQL